MSILKLEPGQKVAMTVAGVTEVQGNFGPQWKFDSTNGDTIFMNVEPAQRQLGRIGLTSGTVLGQLIEFERIVRDGKKFTNINKPGTPRAAYVAPQNVPQAFSSGPNIPGMDAPALPPMLAAQVNVKAFALWDACMDHVLQVAVPKLNAVDVGASPESVAAMTATLYIAASKAQ